MNKKDLLAALVIGEVSAWLLLAVFQNLFQGLISLWILPLFLPLVCGGGMIIASLFKNKMAVLYQFAKFFLVGGLNTLVDLGILNLLLFLTSTSAGAAYVVFKSFSFLLATLNSYFWNKLWTFSAKKGGFGQFLIVSAIGLLVNVGTAALTVNLIGPQFGLNIKTWANVGALIGSVIGLVWNFLGYKFIVFK